MPLLHTQGHPGSVYIQAELAVLTPYQPTALWRALELWSCPMFCWRAQDYHMAELAKEVENGRLLRLLIKMGFVNERPGKDVVSGQGQGQDVVSRQDVVSGTW